MNRKTQKIYLKIAILEAALQKIEDFSIYEILDTQTIELLKEEQEEYENKIKELRQEGNL